MTAAHLLRHQSMPIDLFAYVVFFFAWVHVSARVCRAPKKGARVHGCVRVRMRVHACVRARVRARACVCACVWLYVCCVCVWYRTYVQATGTSWVNTTWYCHQRALLRARICSEQWFNHSWKCQIHQSTYSCARSDCVLSTMCVEVCVCASELSCLCYASLFRAMILSL